MTSPSPLEPRSLPVSQELLIDEICDAFEQARQAGGPPRFEDWLERVEEGVRPHLLRELIDIEVHYRYLQAQTLPPREHQDPSAARAGQAGTFLGLEPAMFPPPNALPYEAYNRIDRLCDRFEQAWASSERPRLEEFLQGVDGLERTVLLQELLRLELQYRARRGERAYPEEYLARLLHENDLMLQIFRENPTITQHSVGQAASSGLDGSDEVATRYPTSPHENHDNQREEETREGPPGSLLPPISKRFTIPGYEILDVLGKGGMGIVYKARQVHLKRVVALKMIRSVEANPEELARFQAEAEAVAALHHANIVQIYEVGQHQGKPFFSLEFVEGGSLDHQLKGNTLASTQAAALVQKLAQAMHAAHERGIVHRDLKPANVLLGSVSGPEQAANERTDSTAELTLGVPKITDFGLAKKLDDDSGQTQTGKVVGTPCYMAPEQARGHIDQIDARTDVYALGAILYECLTGKPPFKGRSVSHTLEQVKDQEPVPLRQLQARVPRDLETITLKCLHKEPQRRYQSAAELAQDLHRFLTNQPIQARPVSPSERLVKWVRRRPALASLYAVVFLAVSSLLGMVAWHYRDLQVRVQEAETRVREYSEQERLQKLREDVEQLLKSAVFAKEQKNWPAVREYGLAASNKAKGEATLTRLSNRAEQVHELAERGIQARRDLATFRDQYQDTLFHLTRFSGRDPADDLADTRASAERALEVFRVDLEGGQRMNLDPTFFPEREQNEIRNKCYTLLLILAEGCASTSGDPGKALGILERARRLGIRTRILQERRARYLDQQGEGDQAEEARHLAEKFKVELALDHFLEGTDQFNANDTAKAIAAFSKALRVEPNHLWARYFQAICYLRENRNGEARVALEACVGGEESETHEDSLATRSRQAWMYLLRGFALGQLKEYVLAEDDFVRALSLHPDEWAQYGVYNNRGTMRIYSGDLDGAVQDCRKAISLKPDRYQAYFSLAEAYKKQKKPKDALLALNQAIQRRKEAWLYRSRAEVHVKLRNKELARRDLENAIQLQKGRSSPQLARDTLLLGKILFDLKGPELALDACTRALQINPKLAEAHQLRGKILLTLKRPREAEQAASVALQHGTPSVELYNLRARAREQQNEHASALTDYTLALEQQPQDSELLRRRGWAYLAVSAAALAERDFQEACGLDANDAEALSGLGLARVTQGSYREGEAASRKALQLARKLDRTNQPVRQRVVHRVAQALALASVQVFHDRSLSSRKAQALHDQYKTEALGLLAEALRLRPQAEQPRYWNQTVEQDPIWAPFRFSPDYERLRHQYRREDF
jgi:serine/threonine protein kinase/Flp pilus assembly protein TadD